MMRMHRRTLLAGAAASTLAMPALGQAERAHTLRLVPQADLANLDPIWTPAAVTANHGFAIFDTLYAVDETLQTRPQMAEGHRVSDDQRTWTIKLREGLRFHDGQPVLGRDCIASLNRWSKKDTFGQLLVAALDTWDAPDDLTIRIRLKRRFPHLPDALGKIGLYAPFIMPERLALTDPAKQVTEMVGSGPYRFLKDEWSVGNRAAYARNEAYVPRDEPASFLAGGKRTYFDRIEWQTIPDASTAAAALARGEVDWLEQTLPDLNGMLSGSKGVKVEALDRWGLISFMQLNTLAKPTDNAKLRQALLGTVDQAAYMEAVAGENLKWRKCASMFPCGMPFSNEVGSAFLHSPPDFAKAREALKAAGYAGERVVIMNPSDFPSIGPLGDVTADAFTKAGMNVDLQTMDWGTLVQRRASKEPVELGGWNVFHSWSPATTMMNPVVNSYTRGLGATGYFGWNQSASLEKDVDDWLNSSTDQQRQEAFDAIQKEAWAVPSTIMLGQYYPTTAYRTDLTGRIQASVPLLWNIRRA